MMAMLLRKFKLTLVKNQKVFLVCVMGLYLLLCVTALLPLAQIEPAQTMTLPMRYGAKFTVSPRSAPP